MEAFLPARFAMQAPLALVGFVLGLAAWWQASHAGFAIGAFAMIAPWPWTIFVIKPVNDALLETEPGNAGPLSRRSLSGGAVSTPSAPASARSPRLLFCGHACSARRACRPTPRTNFF